MMFRRRGKVRCVAPGTSSQTAAFQNIVQMRTTKQQGKIVSTKTLCVHTSGKVKKPTSVKPLKRRRVALINSRKLIYKVISRVKLCKFCENLIEKTEMIVNREACDFTNIACHFETNVT